MSEIAHKRKVNKQRKQTTKKGPIKFEFRSDVVGTWLIATKPDGEQTVINIFPLNEAGEKQVADLKAFGIG